MLYKDVGAQDAIKKPTRRAGLAQGRLVVAEAMMVSSGSHLPQGKAQDIFISHTPVSGREDLNVTPRRAAPRATEHQSPQHTSPAQNLDLSDVEDEFSRHKSPKVQTSVRQVPHCLVLDASASGPSPDIVVTYERSPITIISHCPRSTSKQGSPRVAGEEGFTHWRVDVEQVPKLGEQVQKVADPVLKKGDPLPVKMEQAAKVEADSASRDQVQEERAISPLKAPEDKAPSGGPSTSREENSGSADDVETLVSLSSKKEKSGGATKQPQFKFPQPSFDSPDSEQDNTGGGSRKRAQKVNMEDKSDGDDCSLFEYVPQIKNTLLPGRAKTGSAKKAPKSEKKKKGERIVPSRYMQSAMSKKMPPSSTSDRTLQAKRSLGLQNSSREGQEMGSGSGSRSRRPDSQHHSQSSHQQALSSTPESRGVRKGKTSTPTYDGAPHMVSMLSCDASVINPELSMLSAADENLLRQSSSVGVGQWATVSPHKPVKKLDPKAQQRRLDLHYARYMQWLFLDSKARQSLQQQEKDAMRQLNEMFEIVEAQRESNRDMEKELDRLKHLNMLDEQLDLQRAQLAPLVESLPRANSGYCKFAGALDTTRHQMLIRGVHLPEDEDYFLACLEQVLHETEQLLVQLNTESMNDSCAVHELSAALHTIEKSLDDECREIRRCEELLAAVRSLATHENSLRIQAMQTGT